MPQWSITDRINCCTQECMYVYVCSMSSMRVPRYVLVRRYVCMRTSGMTCRAVCVCVSVCVYKLCLCVCVCNCILLCQLCSSRLGTLADHYSVHVYVQCIDLPLQPYILAHTKEDLKFKCLYLHTQVATHMAEGITISKRS